MKLIRNTLLTLLTFIFSIYKYGDLTSFHTVLHKSVMGNLHVMMTYKKVATIGVWVTNDAILWHL